MDVLLDSNIYVADPKIGGSQFAELFAYLRRTGSSLVLPVSSPIKRRFRTSGIAEILRRIRRRRGVTFAARV
jgi:hypothetical protein